MHPRLFLLLLVTLALISLLGAVMTGSVHIKIAEMLALLTGAGNELHRNLILELRFPRALTAFSVGGMLALAGALMQVLLRNPLADPYILGISGGAAVGALAVMLLGFGGWWITGSAFAGALLSMLIVFSLAHGRGTWTPTRLLLTGVIIAAGWTALSSLILAISPDTSLRSMLFWLMGDMGQSDHPGFALAVLCVGLLMCMPCARDLNVLMRGQAHAQVLGVSTVRLQWYVYTIGSLLTAVAVTLAGSVGFIGLIVPHLIRLVIGSDHRVLLPAAVLLGGSLLVTADTLARTVLSPQQLPVGVITAMLGVPLFLYLMQRSPRQWN